MSDNLLGDALGAYVTLSVVDRLLGRRRYSYARTSRKRKLKRRVYQERGLLGF